MEPTPVPRTPVSQRISGAAESKEDEAAAIGIEDPGLFATLGEGADSGWLL